MLCFQFGFMLVAMEPPGVHVTNATLSMKTECREILLIPANLASNWERAERDRLPVRVERFLRHTYAGLGRKDTARRVQGGRRAPVSPVFVT
jgi:hypothetical protein